jgi:hypothetical protein
MIFSKYLNFMHQELWEQTCCKEKVLGLSVFGPAGMSCPNLDGWYAYWDPVECR